MGDRRKSMGMLAKHSRPSAIFTTVRCPNIVAGSLPGALARTDSVSFPGDTHAALPSVMSGS
jgi:hypothetical protein